MPQRPEAGLYFDDFTVGTRFESPGFTVTEGEIIHFSLRYDPQAFHLDVEAAKQSPYGGLISSGFQTLGLSFRLFLETGAFRACSLGAIGIDEVRWLLPVRPGDTLRVVSEVLEAKASSSKPDRGIARIKHTSLNQRGETVQTMVGIHILRRRPA
jgi:acyl dehydratase